MGVRVGGFCSGSHALRGNEVSGVLRQPRSMGTRCLEFCDNLGLRGTHPKNDSRLLTHLDAKSNNSLPFKLRTACQKSFQS